MMRESNKERAMEKCLLFNHSVGPQTIIGGHIDVALHDYDDGSVHLVHACPQTISQTMWSLVQ